MSTTTGKTAKSTSAASKTKTPSSSGKTKQAASSEAAAKAAAPTSVVSGDAPAAAKTLKPTVVDAPQAVIVGPMMRKKELVDVVVARSGMKKKDVKPVVEMMLSVLGEAIADNRELNLPPFGRLKVRREKTLPNGRMVVAKIRQSTPPVAKTETENSEPTDA